MKTLNLKIENNIAVIEFDRPDSKVNVLNTQTMGELAQIIEQISVKPELKALLITSKKDGIFIAGADIKEIEHITSTKDARRKTEEGKKILNKLASLNLATVAVINGVCLGGGLELALACKYRVAGFSEKIKIGLPEVNLGIIPGFDGTQRLPKLIGLTCSLSMIIPGKIISAKDALKYGLVDRLFPDVSLISESLKFVCDILRNKMIIKRKKKRFIQRFLEDTPVGRDIVFSQARKGILKKTKGFYPAPLKALEVVKQTYDKNIEKGTIIEGEAFAELAITKISKNLIKVFYLNEEFKKLQWVNSDVEPQEVKKCAVVGAGVMGGGIAQLVTYRDIPVRLKDISYEALKIALKTAYGLFKHAVKKKKLKKPHAEYKFGLISPTLTYSGFKNTDVVIEAVVEDLNIKQKVFRELSENTSFETVLATNTSSLPIINIAAALGDTASRVVGLHFFNPVHRMPLVEVIKSSATSEQTLATIIAFARRLGKLAIVVGDVTGFLINRILLSYLNEAGFLLEEGIEIGRIDKIALSFGMPMGPLELIDEIGIDVGYKVAKILEGAYGARMQVCSVLELVKQKGLLGKKKNLGFYRHKGKKKLPNKDIYKFVNAPVKKAISDENILKRMVYVMINEAARCLEEKVADRPETVDIGMIMGTGFPPFRAGLLRYADSVGVDNIVKDLERFEQELMHERFKPCGYIVNIAQNKEKFFKQEAGE